VVDDPGFPLRLFTYLDPNASKESNASEGNKTIDKYPALSNEEIAQLVKSCIAYSLKRFSLLTAEIAYVSRRLLSLIAMMSYEACESLFSLHTHSYPGKSAFPKWVSAMMLSSTTYGKDSSPSLRSGPRRRT
jgi:hypothetical protein